MAFLDLINLEKIRRAILYALCVIVTLVLQTMIFSRVSVLGAKPMFVPVIVVAIGFFEGGMWGGIFGLVTGYFCEMSFSDSTALFLVLFALFGFFAGFFVKFFINRRFFSYFVVCALALLFTAFCQILPLWIYDGTHISALAPTAGLQALWSLPFAVPSYFACRAISRRGGRE